MPSMYLARCVQTNIGDHFIHELMQVSAICPKLFYQKQEQASTLKVSFNKGFKSGMG